MSKPDKHDLKKLERDAAAVMGQVMDYAEIAKQGGPIVTGSEPVMYPNGIDDLPFPGWDVG